MTDIMSGDMYAVGARRAVIFELTADGYPSPGAVPATPYEGIEVLGVKSFDLNIPGVRKISHVGNDRVLAYDFLPTIEGSSATMNVAGRDFTLDALLGGVKEVTKGEMKYITQMTDQQGFEPDVAVFVYQQAKDASTRTRVYRAQIIPKGVISVVPPGQNENPAETKYEIAISPTSKHLWGLDFDPAVDGCAEAGVVEGMFRGRPNIVAWLADGSEDEFNLPTAKPAVSVDKIHATYVDGALVVPDTIHVDHITFVGGAIPTVGQIIVTIYEY